jgi:hypothetical protein
MKPASNPIANAILKTLISPNECDTNFEAANVVDGLFAVARALHHIAKNLRDEQPSETSKEKAP